MQEKVNQKKREQVDKKRWMKRRNGDEAEMGEGEGSDWEGGALVPKQAASNGEQAGQAAQPADDPSSLPWKERIKQTRWRVQQRLKFRLAQMRVGFTGDASANDEDQSLGND